MYVYAMVTIKVKLTYNLCAYKVMGEGVDF